jgi:catechol 2,3-dioxygenase-like lactoylglutathione lyase family enzyme
MVGSLHLAPRGAEPPIGRLHCVVVDCLEPQKLATFYTDLLGMPRIYDSPEWVTIGEADELPFVAFQKTANFRAPTWPVGEVPTQIHLDVMVADLDVAEREVVALGGRLLRGSEKSIGFRVYADPSGHPFCLVTPESVPVPD